MSVINAHPLLLGDDGYQISRSVRLRSSASAYFNRTPAITGSTTTFTFSAWVKRGTLLSSGSLNLLGDSTNAAGEVLDFYNDSFRWSSYNVGSLTTTQVFRDTSAWYHLVFVCDTTNATAASRLRMYVNGVQVTSFSTATYPGLGAACQRVNVSGTPNYIGANVASTIPAYFDGYLTEINFIDGQALTPSSFGQNDPITGVWTPKKYAGTYGTNGFYLPFSDNSSTTNIALDKSGNGNNWTANNISLTAGVTYDSMIDTPTPYADGGNGRGNYAVLNAANNQYGTSTLSQGNLYAVLSAPGATEGAAIGTIGMSTGKWYWEVNVVSANTTYGYPCTIGIGNLSTNTGVGVPASTYAYNSKDGNKLSNTGSLVSAAYGASYTANDVIGVAFDAGAGTLTFYKNNTSQGTAFTGIASDTWFPRVGSNDGCTLAFNFGQRPFSYTPPTGFQALNTQNLPDSTIKAGNKYFDATTYTGNGGTQSIVNAGAFQPDLVWAKGRVAVSSHQVFDAIRGASKSIQSNTGNAESNNSPYGVTSFNVNGFSVNDVAGGDYGVNGGAGGTYSGTPPNYVAWQWKKGATQGFDIVTYTGNGVAGSTINHSLGIAPKMMFVKQRSAGGEQWVVYHASIGATNYLLLNTTGASTASASAWNNTAPTSTVFTVGAGGGWGTNTNTSTYVAYLFAEVAGFSKFGSYTGNGSTDGPFVYCGFRPRFVVLKRTDSANSWHMIDTARDTYNLAGQTLDANSNAAEITPASSAYPIDFLSNGFKIRWNTEPNVNGATYIFAAFAENPFKNALAR